MYVVSFLKNCDVNSLGGFLSLAHGLLRQSKKSKWRPRGHLGFYKDILMIEKSCFQVYQNQNRIQSQLKDLYSHGASVKCVTILSLSHWTRRCMPYCWFVYLVPQFIKILLCILCSFLYLFYNFVKGHLLFDFFKQLKCFNRLPFISYTEHKTSIAQQVGETTKALLVWPRHSAQQKTSCKAH